MNNIMATKESVSDVRPSTFSANTTREDGQHTRYLDKEYIVRAREAEVKHHLHSISELQKKMEKLASELAWELEQHHSKIHELYQLESPFRKSHDTARMKVKSHKKTTTRQKNRQAFNVPVIGEAVCETVA